jgi:hypothetical protein
MAKPLKHPVGNADALALPSLDSKLADYFVNSVGQSTCGRRAGQAIEFVYPTRCKRNLLEK